MKRTIFETENKSYRILELLDECFNVDDLMGDTYNPEVNADIAPDLLARDKAKFIRQVNEEGVFGYVLEKWNPAPGVGYEHVDSCFGFVGQYQEGAEGYDHYIVAELKSQIGGTK